MTTLCCTGTPALGLLWEINSHRGQKKKSSCHWSSGIHSRKKPFSGVLAMSLPLRFLRDACRLGALCAAILCTLVLSARGTEPADEGLPPPIPAPVISAKKYIVGVAPGPPFNIHDPDGSWTGISVELWQQIANELHIDFEFRETNLSGNFDGLAQGWLDIAVGPLTTTKHPNKTLAFTTPYFPSSTPF